MSYARSVLGCKLNQTKMSCHELTDIEHNQIIGEKIGFEISLETMAKLEISDKTQQMLKIAMSELAIGKRLGHYATAKFGPQKFWGVSSDFVSESVQSHIKIDAPLP